MKLKKMIDKTLALYLLVGVLNFIVCTGIMFLLYNVADVSKHFAPIVNYGLGSIIWYLSCNYLLFPGHKTTSKQLLCFVLDIVVCYLLSYYLIGPYVSRLLLRSHSVTRFFSFGGTENIRGNCEMSVGSLSYALLNYFGQRYFVFSDRFAARKDRNTEGNASSTCAAVQETSFSSNTFPVQSWVSVVCPSRNHASYALV